jgi:hypothetical protein
MFMAGMGSYFILGASRIVKTIRAMPAAISKTAAATANRSVGTSKAMPAIPLEISVKRLIPGRGPKVVTVLSQELTLKTKLFKPVVYTSEVDMRKIEELAAKQRKLDWEYDKEHLLTSPFRHASKGAQGVFKSIRRALTREGFVKLKVKGTYYKVDITGGWALEDGKTIDRIVKHEI